MFQDEKNKDADDDYHYVPDSGGSAGSRIFIKGFLGSGRKNNSETGGYGDDQAPSSGEGESGVPEYMKAQPDSMDETSRLVKTEFSSSAGCESEPLSVDYANNGFIDEQSEEQSDSSGIQSGKVSESDSKSSSCASSGIGQEAITCVKVPLGSRGLFANLTAADLEQSNSDDDDGYIVGKKRSYPNEFSQFEDIQSEDTNYSPSNIDVNDIHQETNHRDSLVDAGQQLSVCTSCRKRHEPNVKCGLSSPELRAQQRNRQK